MSVLRDSGSGLSVRTVRRAAKRLAARAASSGSCLCRASLDGASCSIAVTTMTAGAAQTTIGCIYPALGPGVREGGKGAIAGLIGNGLAWALNHGATHNTYLQTRLEHLLAEHESLRAVHAEVVSTAVREANRRRKERRKLKRAQRINRIMDATTRRKNEFLATVSHELRTPMTAILGFADAIRDGMDEEGRREAIETIRRNGEYLLDVINELLDLSEMETGRVDVKKVACSPIETIQNIVAIAQTRAATQGLALEVDFDGPIPETITTDPIRLHHLVTNLVNNALKFTEVGGVRVGVRCVEGADGNAELVIDVADSGTGMTQDQMADLFTPSSRGLSRKYRGSGLELAVSKRLADLLGGMIFVRSRRNEGSTFTVTLPIGSVADAVMIHPPVIVPYRPRQHLPPEGTRLCGHILLAEDGTDNQRLVTMLLRKAGAEVTVAQNGREAVDLVMSGRSAGRRPVDLILMDLQMPAMDGFEATQELRRRGFDKPIIALSALVVKDAVEKARRVGCDAYLSKPIDRTLLLRTVREHLERRDPTLLAESLAMGR